MASSRARSRVQEAQRLLWSDWRRASVRSWRAYVKDAFELVAGELAAAIHQADEDRGDEQDGDAEGVVPGEYPVEVSPIGVVVVGEDRDENREERGDHAAQHGD